MNPPLHQRLLLDEPLPPSEAEALLGAARVLRQAAHQGRVQPVLQGKHIAIVAADTADAAAVAEFEVAATALGARVSRLPPHPGLVEGASDESRDTLRMLPRLYDGVAFDRLDARAAPGLQRTLGLPVVDAGLGHTPAIEAMVARLAADAAASPQDRRFLLQAVLVQAMGR